MLWTNFIDNSLLSSLQSKTAIVSDEGSVTYAELCVNAENLGNFLHSSGITEGHVVHAYIGNIPAFVVTQLATSKAGCTFAPLDIGLTDVEALSILKLTGSDLVVCTEATLSRCRQISKNVIVLDVAGKIIDKEIFEIGYPTVDTDVACIQFSSGSTGNSKGILLSKEAFYYRSFYLLNSLELNQGDKTLCTLPLSHTHGAECLALPTLLAGGTLHLKSPKMAFPLVILQELEKLGITFFSSIPQFYDFSVKLEVAQAPDLSALRHPFCGSAALSTATAESFYARYGVHIKQGYGLAELSVICINRHDDGIVCYDSIGTPINGVEWMLEGGGDEGELLVRSKAMFSGYLNNPELSAEKFKDGWLHTGDVISVDNYGRFRVSGRKEDFVKINGFKVYAAEVESAIIAIEWIKECAVVCEKDNAGVECMVAYIVLADNHAFPEGISREIVVSLRKTLSEYKIPKKYVVRENLPKNPLGKILKAKIHADS